MFAINSYSDVVTIAQTFGVAALRYAMDNRTLSQEAVMTIGCAFGWAANKIVTIEEVNDGNIEYTIDAIFETVKMCDLYITCLDNITIRRQGFGSFNGSATEAMQQGIINATQLEKVLTEIAQRNAAAKAFGY